MVQLLEGRNFGFQRTGNGRCVVLLFIAAVALLWQGRVNAEQFGRL
jgi:hypothetical protein